MVRIIASRGGEMDLPGDLSLGPATQLACRLGWLREIRIASSRAVTVTDKGLLAIKVKS